MMPTASEQRNMYPALGRNIVGVTPLTPALGRLRQEDPKFEAS